jgi:hypothetical protein
MRRSVSAATFDPNSANSTSTLSTKVGPCELGEDASLKRLADADEETASRFAETGIEWNAVVDPNHEPGYVQP